jgi:hypothetical protein
MKSREDRKVRKELREHMKRDLKSQKKFREGIEDIRSHNIS